jgi:translocator protein
LGEGTMPLKNCAKKSGILKLATSLALTLGAGLSAGLFSMNAKVIYDSLKKPAFAPPSWIFTPVWIILYILAGIAFYLVLRKGNGTAGVKSASAYFILQLVFNVLWSALFFTLGLGAAAFVDIVILLFYIAITAFKFYKIDKAAGILMLPYLIFATFAAVLNFSILMLNG